MSINIWTDSMQHAALLGKPVLFTNWLIQRDIIPDGWYCYDLRGTHKSPSTRTTLVDHAADYHAGTVLSPIPLKHEGTASRRVNGTFYLLGEEMTLEQFCEEHDLAYPQDNREFVLRPASLDEVGLFYSEEKLDEALGTVGHLRMDFGHGEKEFWHTWWPHNEDRFNTPEFKEVLQRFVDDLRQTGLLKNLGAMDAYGTTVGAALSESERSGVPLGSRQSIHQLSLSFRAVSLRHDTKSQRHRTLLRQRTDGKFFRHAQKREDLPDRGIQATERTGQNDHFSLYFYLLQPRQGLYTQPAWAAACEVPGVGAGADGSLIRCRRAFQILGVSRLHIS